LRKLSKKANKTYLPKALKLFAFPKESKDLICSDAAVSEGDLTTLAKKPINIIESKDCFMFGRCF